MIGPWKIVRSFAKSHRYANQGIATVSGKQVYRGDSSIPVQLRGQGWTHVGDPDGYEDRLYDAYQGKPFAKLFTVTSPGGLELLVHPLGPDEMPNNSFVAVEPTGTWMVSGEWLYIDRFLVFPTSGSPLPLAGQVFLDRPICNIQGAVFLDEKTMLATSDSTQKLLLRIDLDHPLIPSAKGKVSVVGKIPHWPGWFGVPEVEGIDFDRSTSTLRIDMIPPPPWNLLVTTIYELH